MFPFNDVITPYVFLLISSLFVSFGGGSCSYILNIRAIITGGGIQKWVAIVVGQDHSARYHGAAAALQLRVAGCLLFVYLRIHG